MNRFVFLTVNGLTFGMIYAAVALALVLIWRTTRVLNFAQGAQAMASTYVALSVIQATGSYWVGFLSGLAAGALLAVLIRLTVFRSAETMPPLNAIVIGVGLLVLIEAGVGMVYGIAYRDLPTAFDQQLYTLASVPLASRQDLFILGSVLGVMALLAWMLTRTDIGLRMRSAAFRPEVARLVGVHVSRMLTLGWALAGTVGALAGLLVIPTGLGLYPQAMNAVFVLGFTAAVVGGLDSMIGAVVGGLATGLTLSFVTGYLGSELTYPAALVLLVGVLLVKPNGLFAAAHARRV
jgi:branched-chain amino acid transport system permease protein